MRSYPQKKSLQPDLMFFMCPSSHIGHTNLKKIGKRLRYVSVYLIFWFGSQIFLSIKKNEKRSLHRFPKYFSLQRTTCWSDRLKSISSWVIGDGPGMVTLIERERYERFWWSVGCYPIHFSQARSRIIHPNWRFLSRYREEAQIVLGIDEQSYLLPRCRRVFPETPYGRMGT